MYMAPEQAQGETLDQRADLFSLGSVLYPMCSGRPPFRRPTLAVLKRVAEDTPRPIREIIPEMPQWLCDIIARLHAKKPDDRFQSAREVAALLTRYLAEWQEHGRVMNPAAPSTKTAEAAVKESEPVQSPPVKHRTPQRSKVVSAGVLLALAVGAGVYVWPGRGAAATPPPKP